VSKRACVVGAGPNGLSAAAVLAQRGLHVEIFEAEAIPGGAARTLELTLPGFHHDFGSAVHPLAAGSPFFSSLPMRQYGLEWIHSPAPLAHPLNDGSAVVLERDLHDTELALGKDGRSWRKLVEPLAKHWFEFVPDVLSPQPAIPSHPILMARFGLSALPSARFTANLQFRDKRTKALWAGLAGHSFLSMEEALSSSFAVVLGAAAHAIGWPIARTGSQAITHALCQYLSTLGAVVKTSTRVESLEDLTSYEVICCDVTPRQLLRLGERRFGSAYKRRLANFSYGPAAFKVDYALSEPIPWKAPECRRAATLHLGGSFDEIAESESAVRNGKHAERPFVLLSQPSLFDPSRAPTGKHVAWAYCHVPNGSDFNMLERLESQIERFAPGFRECVLARNICTPSVLERMDANLVGGDINGGILNCANFLFRPTWRHYATSAKGVYICSSSTPPGGGVHGMCGYHAAKLALSRL
jgi:phytoene dehydrogenase-like protein